MNYQIITDREKLEEFIDWLPDLKPHEKYYLCLFARKKYAPGMQGIKTDKSQLRRITSCKKRMMEKIMQMECPVGSFQHNGIVIPQEALALYISPSPRDMRKATTQGLIDLAKKVQNCSDTEEVNPHQIIMSTIQRTRGTKNVITFDIDSKDPAILNDLRSVSGEGVSIIETRGGYHFLIRPELMPKNNGQWHKHFKQYADITGDALCPVVGTHQGGHTPTFIQKCKPFNEVATAEVTAMAN